MESTVVSNLSLSWRRVEETAAKVRHALRDIESSKAGKGNGSAQDSGHFSKLKESLAAVETALEDCRNSTAMIDAMGLTVSDAANLGLNGRPLKILQESLRGSKDTFEDIDLVVSQARGKLAELEASSVLGTLSVDEIVEGVESVALTSYVVPQGQPFPNWCNVLSGMTLVDKWMRSMQQVVSSSDLSAKMRQVCVRVFNSKTLRHPDDMTLANRQSAREKWKHVFGAAQSATESTPSNLEFLTSIEVAQNCLREILVRFAWRYRLAIIEGDGNCFYRGIVRGLTPNIPRDFEDSFSLQLRKQVNALDKSQIKGLSDFEVIDESDAKTMSQAGVWADHVQVAKTSLFLGRAVCLLRSDDDSVKLTDAGQLETSPLYFVNSCEEEQAASRDNTPPPLLLFYQTSPGHFETLNFAEDRDSSLADALSAKPKTLLSIVDCFFRLESALLDAQDLASPKAGLATMPLELRDSLRMELVERIGFLRTQLDAFRQHISQVVSSESMDSFKRGKEYALYGDLFDRVVADCKQGHGADDFGPVSQLKYRLEQLSLRASEMVSVASQLSSLSPAMRFMDNEYSHLASVASGADMETVDLRGPGHRAPRPRSPEPISHDDRKNNSRYDDMDDDYFGDGAAFRPESSMKPPKPQQPSPAPISEGIPSLQSLLQMADIDASVPSAWEHWLMANEGKHMEIRNISVSDKGLKACYDAFDTLYSSKRVQKPTHLVFSDCSLSQECCELIKKPPRLVSLVRISNCTYPDAFKIWFKVKQHIQLDETPKG